MNEAGVPCYATDVISMFVNASLACTTTTSCSADCRAIVSRESGHQQDAASTTSSMALQLQHANTQIPILTSEFWEICGVITPGICQTPFTHSLLTPSYDCLVYVAE